MLLPIHRSGDGCDDGIDRTCIAAFHRENGGSLLLLCVVIAGLAGFARRGMLIGGDAAATATNIIAHQSLYQLGFACDLLSVASYIIVVVLFHQLLKPVNGTVSMIAACFGFMGCVIIPVGGVLQLAP